MLYHKLCSVVAPDIQKLGGQVSSCREENTFHSWVYNGPKARCILHSYGRTKIGVFCWTSRPVVCYFLVLPLCVLSQRMSIFIFLLYMSYYRFYNHIIQPLLWSTEVDTVVQPVLLPFVSWYSVLKCCWCYQFYLSGTNAFDQESLQKQNFRTF